MLTGVSGLRWSVLKYIGARMPTDVSGVHWSVLKHVLLLNASHGHATVVDLWCHWFALAHHLRLRHGRHDQDPILLQNKSSCHSNNDLSY